MANITTLNQQGSVPLEVDWERKSYGEFKETQAEQFLSERKPIGTLYFNGAVTEFSKDILGTLAGNLAEAAGSVLQEAPEAFKELWNQLSGRETKTGNQNTAPEDSKIKHAEHLRFSFNKQSEASSSTSMAKQREFMEAALRISGGEMTGVEVQADHNPNTSETGSASNLGIGDIVTSWNSMVEQRNRAKQANDHFTLGTGNSSEPNYFMQQNMVGERSGGMHVLNAAG